MSVVSVSKSTVQFPCIPEAWAALVNLDDTGVGLAEPGPGAAGPTPNAETAARSAPNAETAAVSEPVAAASGKRKRNAGVNRR